MGLPWRPVRPPRAPLPTPVSATPSPADCATDRAARGRWRRGLAGALASWCLALCALPAAAQPMITLLDGEAVVIEEARRLSAVPGLRLSAGAIVDTGSASPLVRIEWPDGTAADLGAGTRVMVAPPGFAARGGKAPLLYLLQGWVKLGGAGREPVGGVVTPALELLPFAGAAVVVADRRERHVFAEAGALELLERPGGRRVALGAGAFYGADGVLPRPPADWLARVPRAFRDAIPRRAASLAGRDVAGGALPLPAYAAVADWLAAEPALRKPFPRRFLPWAADPAFRRELQSHLSAHREWDPILNPPPPPTPTLAPAR